jgi:hypothetical protein
MSPSLRPGLGLLPGLIAALATGACARDQTVTPVTPAAAQATSGCLASGAGRLQASLRGALVADLDWQNGQMQCEGGPRPDGRGLRLTIAGPLPPLADAKGAASAPRQLRFIFGIDLADIADGAVQVLPTNLTVIVEGGQQLFATRGHDKCAVESLQRLPLATGGDKLERVDVRGYCIGPASALNGDARVLVPTFAFTALVRNGDSP